MFRIRRACDACRTVAPFISKSILSEDTYIVRIREITYFIFSKRVKRGPNSVRIVDIVIVVAARSIEIVSIVSITVVAGTQPRFRCELPP